MTVQWQAVRDSAIELRVDDQGADFDIVNLISSLVVLVLLPFGAVLRTYLYHDLRVRESRAVHGEKESGLLPAELDDDGTVVASVSA